MVLVVRRVNNGINGINPNAVDSAFHFANFYLLDSVTCPLDNWDLAFH